MFLHLGSLLETDCFTRKKTNVSVKYKIIRKTTRATKNLHWMLLTKKKRGSKGLPTPNGISRGYTFFFTWYYCVLDNERTLLVGIRIACVYIYIYIYDSNPGNEE